MKSNVILIISCLFTLFLANAAHASNFSGNTCHEAGANCQSDEDWVYGWCEAAVAAGVFQGTAEQCVQPGGGGGQLIGSTQNQNSTQSENPTPSDSNREQSDGGQRSSSGNSDAQDSAANSSDEGSRLSSAQGETCKQYRVSRTDPDRLVCVRPASGSAPDSSGTGFDPFDTTPILGGTAD